MVMLGDLLGGALRAWPALPAALADRLAADGDPEAGVRRAVAHFERQALPDDWATLMGRLAGAEDPGAACLEYMVRWSLGDLPAVHHEERHDGRDQG